jgi:hypothetical protein
MCYTNALGRVLLIRSVRKSSLLVLYDLFLFHVFNPAERERKTIARSAPIWREAAIGGALQPNGINCLLTV